MNFSLFFYEEREKNKSEGVIGGGAASPLKIELLFFGQG